ncbi:MAG: hypothetical protein Q9210_001264 [Variospora velana]
MPNTYYQFGSPFGGKSTNDPTVGDIHQWNVWHGAQELGGRFVAEFYMQAYPSVKMIESYLLKGKSDPEQLAQSSTIDFYNKAVGHGRRLATYMIESIPYSHSALDYYVYYTQLMQAECLATAFVCGREAGRGPTASTAVVLSSGSSTAAGPPSPVLLWTTISDPNWLTMPSGLEDGSTFVAVEESHVPVKGVALEVNDENGDAVLADDSSFSATLDSCLHPSSFSSNPSENPAHLFAPSSGTLNHPAFSLRKICSVTLHLPKSPPFANPFSSIVPAAIPIVFSQKYFIVTELPQRLQMERTATSEESGFSTQSLVSDVWESSLKADNGISAHAMKGPPERCRQALQ